MTLHVYVGKADSSLAILRLSLFYPFCFTCALTSPSRSLQSCFPSGVTHSLALSQHAHSCRLSAKTTTTRLMGPAAFMWPSDRPWSADVDNVAPCGSSAGVGNRTNYPMSASYVRPFSSLTYRQVLSPADGRLALVLRDDISKLHISVAYNNGELVF